MNPVSLLRRQLGASLGGLLLPDRKTLVSGAVDSIADPGPAGLTWTAPTSGRRPIWGASGLGGRPYIELTNAGNHALATTAGGITGAAAHGVFAAVAFTDPSILGFIGGFGRPSGNATAGVGDWAGLCWGGGATHATPQGGAADTAPLIIGHDYDGSIASLWANDTKTAADSYAFALSNGSFVGNYDNNSSHTASVRIYEIVYVIGAVTATMRRQIHAHFAAMNPAFQKPSFLGFSGDSMFRPGFGTAAQMYPAKVVDALLATYGKTVTIGNDGAAGERTDQILAETAANLLPFFTRQHASEIFMLGGGTNNITGTYPGAGPVTNDATSLAVANATLADDAAEIAAAKANGVEYFVVHTLLPNSQNDTAFKLSCRARINAGRVALVAAASSESVALCDWATVPEGQDTTNATYYHEAPNGIHPTEALNLILGSLGAAACRRWVS